MPVQHVRFSPINNFFHDPIPCCFTTGDAHIFMTLSEMGHDLHYICSVAIRGAFLPLYQVLEKLEGWLCPEMSFPFPPVCLTGPIMDGLPHCMSNDRHTNRFMLLCESVWKLHHFLCNPTPTAMPVIDRSLWKTNQIIRAPWPTFPQSFVILH